MFKQMLNQESIPFNDIDVVKNHSFWKEISNQTGENLVPTFFIHDETDNSGLAYVPNRDFMDLEQGIKIIKEQI